MKPLGRLKNIKGGFAPGNYTCKCVSCKENFMGDKRAVRCEDCAEKVNKPYWKSIKEEYEIHLNGELMDVEVFKWYEKDREQANYLIEKYGSCSWRINKLAKTTIDKYINDIKKNKFINTNIFDWMVVNKSYNVIIKHVKIIIESNPEIDM